MGQPKRRRGRVTPRKVNWSLINRFWPDARPGNLPAREHIQVLEQRLEAEIARRRKDS